MWGLISKDNFIVALLSGLLLLFIGLAITWCEKKYRLCKIYKILKSGLAEKNTDFLPTAYLSSKSGYTQSQVEALCSHHSKIRRHEKEVDSWCIESSPCL